MSRIATGNRKTKETEIILEVDLDGSGKADITTGIPFFDHMLELMFRNALMDIKFNARGDLEVDGHHTVEDAGLAIGKALKDALGDKKGITRYGWSMVPMDESLARVSIDVSGRPFMHYSVEISPDLQGNFDPTLAEDFFQALANEACLTLHVELMYGRGVHHSLEAVFKAVGRALRQAVSIDPREDDIPSTKGSL